MKQINKKALNNRHGRDVPLVRVPLEISIGDIVDNSVAKGIRRQTTLYKTQHARCRCKLAIKSRLLPLSIGW